MTTATQVTQEVQDRVLDTVRVGQKAVVDFVKSWAQTVEATFTRLPEWTLAEQRPGAGPAFENVFGFTEKLLASQREFATQLWEAAVPATRGFGTAGAQAAAASKSR